MSTMHPSDRHYRNQTVRLADLTVISDQLTDLVFENCTVEGPAVIHLMGCTLNNCAFEGDIDALVWVVPDTMTHAVGGVAMINTEFHGCRFRRIGVAVQAAFAETMKRELSGG